MTPADYVRRFRLSQSALKLRDKQMKIAEVAFALGFGSVDGYQRAFFREFGCNPREYDKSPIPLQLFIPYEIKYGFEQKENKMETVKNIFIQVVEKPKKDVITKRGAAKEHFAYCDEVGCDVWGMLTSIKSIFGEPICMWIPKNLIRKGTSEYRRRGIRKD